MESILFAAPKSPEKKWLAASPEIRRPSGGRPDGGRSGPGWWPVSIHLTGGQTTGIAGERPNAETVADENNAVAIQGDASGTIDRIPELGNGFIPIPAAGMLGKPRRRNVSFPPTRRCSGDCRYSDGHLWLVETVFTMQDLS